MHQTMTTRLRELQATYGKACQTKSTNDCVLDIYALVLRNQENGFNYWEEGHGAQDIMQMFTDHFTPFDHQALLEDLTYWSDFQLERFMQGMLGDHHAYLNADGTFPPSYREQAPLIALKLGYIYRLLQLEKERALAGNFSDHLREDMDFLALHVDMLVQYDASLMSVLIDIARLLNLQPGNSTEIDRYLNAVGNTSKSQNGH